MNCPYCCAGLTFQKNIDEWYCHDCANIRLDKSMPIIIGSCYQHQWSEKSMFLIAASMISDEDYVELSSSTPKGLRSHGFNEFWHGRLDDFYKHWFYDEEFDRQAREEK